MRYTIRVYGILEWEGSVLISREYFRDTLLFKFPGGGMEEGEGTIETLIREYKEELGIDVEIKEHLYTTDFYAKSHFDPSVQVISIYYLVETPHPESIPVEEKGAIPLKGELEKFQWYPIQELSREMFTFPTEAAAFAQLVHRI